MKGTFSQDLEAGPQLLRFTITGSSCNIDKVVLKNTTTGIERSTFNVQRSTFNLHGQQVDANYKGLVIRNGRKYLNR